MLQKEGSLHLRLSKAIYNFTDTQDVRLAVGYKAKVDEKGVIRGVRCLCRQLCYTNFHGVGSPSPLGIAYGLCPAIDCNGGISIRTCSPKVGYTSRATVTGLK